MGFVRVCRGERSARVRKCESTEEKTPRDAGPSPGLAEARPPPANCAGEGVDFEHAMARRGARAGTNKNSRGDERVEARRGPSIAYHPARSSPALFRKTARERDTPRRDVVTSVGRPYPEEVYT